VRARVAALALAVLTAAGLLTAFTPGPAGAQGAATFPPPVNTAPPLFSGYSVGAMEHVEAITAGNTRLANVDAPLSTASFNSHGLAKGILSETGATVSPAQAGKSAYASTGAAQVGLGTDPTQFKNQNQIILSKLVEASAPPSTDVVKDQLVEIPGNPLVYALAAYERSAANWSTDACPLGQPIAYSENALAKAEVLNTNTAAGAPALGATGSQPLVSVNTGSYPRSTNFSKSYNYLFPNGDGTFGVGSITHMTIAPVTLFKDTANELTIEVSGPITLRAEASGKPGGAKVDYLPDTNGNAPVITVHMGGKLMGTLGLNDILGKTGLPPIDIGQGGQNLLEIRVANPAHAIGNEKAGPTQAADGTEASAASDIIRVTLLNIPNTIKGAELRLGHMEAKAVVPAGGVECTVPVSKTANPQTVTAGNPFTWNINIPTSIDAFKNIDCDLKDITATDTAHVLSGTGVKANITDVSGNGTPKSGTIDSSHSFTTKWTGLSYKRGDPPIQLTITGNIPQNSGAGVIENTVNVTGTLTNCKGGAAGQDLIGNATVNGKATTLNGGAVVGAASVKGPEVKAAAVLAARTELATTGQKDPWLPVLGGGLLLGALALMRSRRRLAEVHAETR